MPSMREYQRDILAPGWLQDPVGRAFLDAFGAEKDVLSGWANEAVKARMPGICPADAVGVLSAERGIDRALVETDASFRARVKAAWDIWQWAGTPYGLLLALYWAGYTPTDGKILLQVQNGKQYALRDDFDPGLHDAASALVISNMAAPVHLGGTPELWSEFAVLLVQPWPARWSGSPPADGSAEQQTASALVAKWKPGHARCVKFNVVSGPTWGLNMTWGSFVWGAGTSVTWTPPAA